MCGRYLAVTENEMIQMQKIFEDIGRELDISKTIDIDYKEEIYPSNFAPVIVSNGNKFEMRFMKWGFSCSTAGRTVINARSETASIKNLFKNPLAENRCMVPSRGFFEWKKFSDGKAKEKIFIRSDFSSLFFMAGIFRRSGKNEEFVILTMPAVAGMVHIHDRMPLFVLNAQINKWFDDTSQLNALMANIFTAPGIFTSKA